MTTNALVKLSILYLSDGNAASRARSDTWSSLPSRPLFHERKFENDTMLKATIIKIRVTGARRCVTRRLGVKIGKRVIARRLEKISRSLFRFVVLFREVNHPMRTTTNVGDQSLPDSLLFRASNCREIFSHRSPELSLTQFRAAECSEVTLNFGDTSRRTKTRMKQWKLLKTLPCVRSESETGTIRNSRGTPSRLRDSHGSPHCCTIGVRLVKLI